LAARRWPCSCRAFQAARIRWLRTISSVVVNSMRGGGCSRRPVRVQALAVAAGEYRFLTRASAGAVWRIAVRQNQAEG
jgi:hypothetical protein